MAFATLVPLVAYLNIVYFAFYGSTIKRQKELAIVCIKQSTLFEGFSVQNGLKGRSYYQAFWFSPLSRVRLETIHHLQGGLNAALHVELYLPLVVFLAQFN